MSLTDRILEVLNNRRASRLPGIYPSAAPPATRTSAVPMGGRLPGIVVSPSMPAPPQAPLGGRLPGIVVANPAAAAPTQAPSPGYSGPMGPVADGHDPLLDERALYGGSATQPDPTQGTAYDLALSKLRSAQQRTVTDGNGRLRSAALMMGQPTTPTNSIGNLIGQKLGQFASGALRPKWDEEAGKERDIAEAEKVVATEGVLAKQDLDRRETEADIANKKSLPTFRTEEQRRRADEAAAKAKRDVQKQQQALIQREIAARLREPRPFDADNESDADLFNRAAALGVHVQTGSFGDYKNPFTLEVEDPTDPTGTRKTRVVIPRGGGSPAPIMGADGVPIVTERVEARDGQAVPVSKREQIDNTEEFRAKMLGLSSARLQETMANGLTGRASKVFATKTAGLFGQRSRIETMIAGFRTRASKKEIMPAEAERRIADLQSKLDEVTGQIESARTAALDGMSQPSPSASSPASSRKYTADEVRARARSSGKDPEAAVNAARSKGLLKE